MPIESTRVETLQYSGWRYKSGKQNYSIEEGFLCDSCPWKTAVDGVKIGVWFVYALILLSYFTAPSILSRDDQRSIGHGGECEEKTGGEALEDAPGND